MSLGSSKTTHTFGCVLSFFLAVTIYTFFYIQHCYDGGMGLSCHLKQLEADAIHIIRQALASIVRQSVVLFSAGKDSCVLEHIFNKAIFPEMAGNPIFLHIDTGWKFKEMYEIRERIFNRHANSIVKNRDVILKETPFSLGSEEWNRLTKTVPLKTVLKRWGADIVIGGARREEEKARAKERVFSLRNIESQAWDPNHQNPEFWDNYNTAHAEDESFRVFPLSDWTELDLWEYIKHEQIPVASLYFAKERPVVERNGMLIVVDDDRFELNEGEEPVMKKVRFRTLGCYPLTGCIESDAETIDDIIEELKQSKFGERIGRAIDYDRAGAMEQMKKEGYF